MNLYQNMSTRTERDFARVFTRSPLRSFMFFLVTALAVVVELTGIRLLERFWSSLSFTEQFNICLMLVVATYPWIGMVAQYWRVRKIRDTVPEKMLMELGWASTNSIYAIYFALWLALTALDMVLHNCKG